MTQQNTKHVSKFFSDTKGGKNSQNPKFLYHIQLLLLIPRKSYIMWVYDKQLQKFDNDVISNNKMKVNHLNRRVLYLSKNDMKIIAFNLIEGSRDLWWIFT